MNSLSGFIKLHRKLLEWGWYSDCVVKDVFLHLLIIAKRYDETYLNEKLSPGDAIIRYKNLAQDLGFSVQQVRTAVKKLESTGEISLKSTNKFTVATIEKWAFYQGDEWRSNKRITNK